jgi:hypothetical protein
MPKVYERMISEQNIFPGSKEGVKRGPHLKYQLNYFFSKELQPSEID